MALRVREARGEVSAKMDEACAAYRAAIKAHKTAERAESIANSRWSVMAIAEDGYIARGNEWGLAVTAMDRAAARLDRARARVLALAARGVK